MGMHKGVLNIMFIFLQQFDFQLHVHQSGVASVNKSRQKRHIYQGFAHLLRK